ncbi:Serine protease, subtilase family [Nakamurella panacisegetis]|uniref:Serine protease, subtilase family n=1 Tax=Nakamurella panacisegetis TaxID=1090615 RepID=A0A1H0QSA7_9ACTN|nr:S53 family peptidase [Nakamurella panacisegetis]SDP20070.1 Serine protease, subtilase family [Nakamurella panacisegetis]
MKHARRLGLILMVAVLTVLGTVPATATPPVPGTRATATGTSAPAVDYAPVCTTKPRVGQYACLALRRTNAHVKGLRPSDAPPGFGPAQIQGAYNLPAAPADPRARVFVIDAFGYAGAEADLAAYRAQYGLRPCTTASGCLQILNQDGDPQPPPAGSSGWVQETALDLDMVSATCPYCQITLIQANDDSDNLFLAVQQATTLGAKYVSMSWGGSEFSGQGSYDHQFFAATGVAYVASSGDFGYGDGTSYPASSRNVVGVGGTRLVSDSSTARGWTETTWGAGYGDGTGSGCSAYTPKPAWQQIVAGSTCTNRAINDVSAVADPQTGVAVYVNGAWDIYGGTSAAAPIIASTYALAGTPAAAPASSLYAQSSALNDVTTGVNGNCSAAPLCTAGFGWDGPTGLGTPNGTAAFTAPAESVTMVNPDTQVSTVGAAVNLTVTATASAVGATITYQAVGLPAGLTMSSGGIVTGAPTTLGTSTVRVTATANSATSTAVFTWRVAVAGTFASVGPSRLLDTRSGLGAPKGKVAGPGVVNLKVLGRGGVPLTGVSTVLLNVTVTQESGAGYLTVYAGGTTRPGTSNLNYRANIDSSSLVTAPVGADGTVNLFTNLSTHVVADVFGYYVQGAPSVTGSYKPVTPSRILDSRTGIGAAKQKVVPGTTLSVQIAGRGNLPTSGLSAVVVTATVVNAASSGFITLFPSGSPTKPIRPVASNVNFATGVTMSNMAVVPVGNDGKIQLYMGGGGADVILDVAGYYLKSASPSVSGSFVALTPSRVVDTRTGNGGYSSPLLGGQILPAQITGRGGVPTSGVAAVFLNMLAVSPTAAGYVTVFSDDLSIVPATSNLNFYRGQTVANMSMSQVSSTGVVDMGVVTGGQTDLVADVAGYFRS